MLNNSLTKVKIEFYIFLLFFAFFFPLFRNYIGTAGAIAINGFLIIFIGLYFLYFLKEKLKFQDQNLLSIYKYFAFIFVFMLLHIPLASSIGVTFGSIQPVVRDFFELHRPILYILVFSVAFFTFVDLNRIGRMHILLLGIFTLLVLFGLNHFFHFNEFLTSIYTKEANASRFRVAIPFVNPYDYAFMISFFVFYFFVNALYRSKWYILLTVLALIMFILPQSRSVAAGMLIGIFVVLPFILIYLNLNKQLVFNKPFIWFGIFFITISISFLAMIPYLLENFPYLTTQFVKFSESGDIGNSANTRLEQFYFALDKAQNPLIFLFGNGPAKDELEYVESIYNYQFYRYGIVGIILYLIYPLLLSSYFLVKILKKLHYGSELYPLYLTLLLWFVTIPLMSIGNNFTEQIRISFFYYSMLGLVARSYYLIVIENKKGIR